MSYSNRFEQISVSAISQRDAHDCRFDGPHSRLVNVVTGPHRSSTVASRVDPIEMVAIVIKQMIFGRMDCGK
jgi:hypothetical protein